ncbi:4'-phosphopantetheinyl transferase superfamily protein [Nonomuraea sp. NPDC050404]|uniref:4'-phosphopantetheinyl transferase family protein n=1 Tax=Nonomuraea sp. NPDC050404 TaxID=3155783 RepID=UPI003408D1EE
MIEEILPDAVVSVESFGDAVDPMLFPEEEAVVARAVAKRRAEFATVRACARTALAKLGHPPAPLLPGERGAPIWPDGVVGSMTHCADYRACAVSSDGDTLAVGIDAEPHDRLPDGVLEAVSDPWERAWIARLGAERPEVSWDRLLFCAKEAVYKAWFPLTRRWLDFSEASLSVDPLERTFSARLSVTGHTAGGLAITGFRGRWLARDGLVLTTIVVPAGPDAQEQLQPR